MKPDSIRPWRLLALLLLAGLASPALADSCGRENERPCNLNERIPSCDLNLVEGSTGRCLRLDCGAENQRNCGLTRRVVRDIVLKTPTPLPCDVNLKNDGGVCVHPPCGRDGERPCTVFERVPSCDANLMEEAGRCVHPPQCGREGQQPCPITFPRTAFGPCDVNLIPRNGQCVRPGVPDGTATASTGTHGAAPVTSSTPAPPPVSPVPPPTPVAPPPAATAAAAGAIEPDTDRMGSDIYGFPLAQADPAGCQSACTVNAQCQAWTFVKAGVKGPQAQCFLKNSAPAPTRNSCCVSGTKAAAAAQKPGGLLKTTR